MMNEYDNWTHARTEYENIPLPPTLERRIRQGIADGSRRRKRTRRLQRWGACAACLVFLVGCLNLSPTIAAAAAELPVVGGLFEILTIRDYTETNDDRTLHVVQPGIVPADDDHDNRQTPTLEPPDTVQSTEDQAPVSEESDNSTDFAKQIDREIQARVDEKIAEGEARIAGERDAFFATGGTEEEWAARNNEVQVDYEVRYQSDRRVSFVLDTYIVTSTANQQQFFYNLDLSAGRELTLKDLLGDDWKRICDDSIRAQMAAAEDPTVFFAEDRGGFSGIDETTDFYINAAGNPVIVFPKYSIAIGAMGIVEFEITE